MDLEIHNECCSHNCELQFDPSEYRFEFLFQSHIAKVFPCVHGNGTPHSEILDNGMKQIMKELEISYYTHLYPFSTYQGSISHLQGDWNSRATKQQREDGVVNEIIKIGGFSNIFYYEHKIEDIRKMDVQKIIDNCGDKYDNNISNVLNLLIVLGFKKEYNKLVKKHFNE